MDPTRELEGPGASSVKPQTHNFTTSTKPIMEPLTFPTKRKKVTSTPSVAAAIIITDENNLNFSSRETLCMLCDETFDVEKNQDKFLAHLLEKHHLVIADVKKIARFKKYVEYWRCKFSGQESELHLYCHVVQTNNAPTDRGEQELYYLLSDQLPEDGDLRKRLHRKQLDYVLETQRKERTETLTMTCLFCKRKFDDNKSVIFTHMFDEHSFNIGVPDNIVFWKEFLNFLRDTLDRLKCLFCENSFKNSQSLKDHMRKKHHRQINPENTAYDKYYIANYQELGKNWTDVKSVAEREINDTGSTDSEKSWEDWREEVTDIVCLFCQHSTTDFNLLTHHMTTEHVFNFDAVRTELSFYNQMKLINYIRRQMFQNKCPYCELECGSRVDVLQHLRAECLQVGALPDEHLWQKHEYFFPTYENDSFLLNLDDSSDGSGKPETLVLAEDLPNITDSILSDPDVRQELGI